MIDKEKVREGFAKSFFFDPDYLFQAHGRLEIIGNHTDHNHGLCLVGGVDMGTLAAVRKTEDGVIRVISKGYRPAEVDLLHEDLAPKASEHSSSQGLIRGVASKMKELGYKIGGFEAYLDSDIFKGAGVSSSACFESLIAGILDSLYNDGHMDPMEMAKIGQYAENVYFGKPCGLLDQIGSCLGGLNYVDFLDLDKPGVEPLEWKLPLHAVLVNSGGSHAGLTGEYASIGDDMKSVAKNLFGKEYLRQVSRADFFARIGMPNSSVSELAKMRATHFFEENVRVQAAAKAIRESSPDDFLEQIRQSGYSSTAMLQNTMVPLHYPFSPQEAIDRLTPYLGAGAMRIMGGGFAGSCIAFLYPRDLPGFLQMAKKYYGESGVRVVSLVSGGPKFVE